MLHTPEELERVSSRPKAAQIRKPRPGRVRCPVQDMRKAETKTRPHPLMSIPLPAFHCQILDLDFTESVGLLVCFFLRERPRCFKRDVGRRAIS